MASRLFQSVVGMGIALGVAQAGCVADVHGSTDEAPAASRGAGSSQAAITDPIASAFCDTPWPTTKGASVTQAPSCDDPLGECVGIPVTQSSCQSPSTWAAWACTSGAIFPACVGGHWECPTGAWTCLLGVMHPPEAAASDGGAG